MRVDVIATQARGTAKRSVRQSLWALLRVWLARRRTRRALDRLPDHLLRDIGLDRPTARREAEKPFWRA